MTLGCWREGPPWEEAGDGLRALWTRSESLGSWSGPSSSTMGARVACSPTWGGEPPGELVQLPSGSLRAGGGGLLLPGLLPLPEDAARSSPGLLPAAPT